MYDLPDSTLGSLRSLRLGLATTIVLLVLSGLMSAWLTQRGSAVQAEMRDQAYAQVETIYQGRRGSAEAAADAAWAMLQGQAEQITLLALAGITLHVLLIVLGFRGVFALCWSVLLAVATGVQAGVPVLIASDAPHLGGLQPAGSAWQLWSNIAWLSVLATYLLGITVIFWRLLTVPLPGRDDMSTFVEL